MSTHVPLELRMQAALAANFSVTLLTNPLDVMKVRAQAYNESTVVAYRAVLANRGVPGFYSGIVPALTMSIPTVTIYYCLYDAIRPFLESYGLAVPVAGCLGGGMARAVAVTVASPLELIKTQLQYGASGHQNHHSMLTGLLDLWRGRRMWTGLGATIARDMPFSMLYWLIVEHVRSHRRSGTEDVSLQRQLAAGLIGAATASIVTHPFDVIKTVQQTPASGQRRTSRAHKLAHVAAGTPDCAIPTSSPASGVCVHGSMHCKIGCGALTSSPLSLAACARKIYAADGFRGFAVGLLPRLVRVPISCSLMLVSFEAAKRRLRSQRAV